MTQAQDWGKIVLASDDAPTENELLFMQLVMSRPKMSLTQAYMTVYPSVSKSVAGTNGCRLIARVLRKGWIQIAFDQVGLTAGLIAAKMYDMLEADDVIQVKRDDGIIDYYSTPNWQARLTAIKLLSKIHGMMVEPTDTEGDSGKETFADRIRQQFEARQKWIAEHGSNGNGNKPQTGE